MEYNIPIVIDSDNRPIGLFYLFTSYNRRLVIIFSDIVKQTAFSSLASNIASRQGKKLGWIKMDGSSFEDVVRELQEQDPALVDAITFLHDSDPFLNDILQSGRDSIAWEDR